VQVRVPGGESIHEGYPPRSGARCSIRMRSFWFVRVERMISVRGVLRTIVATFLLTAMMELVLIVLSVLVTP